MAATASLTALQASHGLGQHEERSRHLDLHSVSMASNVQAILEPESEAGESVLARAASEEQEEREAEHEQLGAAPNKHEELTAARRMLTAMFPSMDVEVVSTVLAWNGGDVELAASSILDMWTDGESNTITPDHETLARVLQRSLPDQQDDEQAARALQLAWQAEELEELERQKQEQLARRIAETCNGNRPPPPLARQTSRAKMLAFLRARGTAPTSGRITARLLDADDLPREITPSATESAPLAGYAPPPLTRSAAAVDVLADATADARPLSAAAPEGRYDARVQRAKKANLARKLSSEGNAPLLTKLGSCQSVCSLDLAGGTPAAE